MAHEVIMPALGMAQQTGQILAWRKSPGDAVKAGDVLMEVETDKAAMEVEAQADGYLTDVLRGEGEDVPVGEVIAIISETAGATREPPAAKAAPETVESEPESYRPSDNETAPAPPQPAPKAREEKPATSAPANGKVLASPKARRLAAERGLDITRLAGTGRLQPYHVADLEHLAALPAGGGARDRLEARVAAAGFDDFLAFFEAETGAPANTSGVLAAFAAASLRMAGNAPEGPLVIAAERIPAQGHVLYADPDLCGLVAVAPAQTGTPALLLRDLTNTRLSAMQSASDGLPVISVTRDGDVSIVALDFEAGALDNAAAIALVSEMAARLEEPLRHLL